MTNDPRSRLAAELAALRLRVRELESRNGGRRLPLSAAERVLASSNDGALWADRDGRISFFNSVATELTGWAVDDALGTDIRRVLAPAQPEATHPIEAALTLGSTEHRDRFAIVDRKGETVQLAISTAPLMLRGEVAGVVASFNLANAPRSSTPAEFSQAQFDALLDVAAADEIDDASFREVAESLLEALVSASGADRVVLLLTERADGQAAHLMIEAPAGSQPPSAKAFAGKRKRQAHATTVEAEGAPLADALPSLGDAGVSSIVALPLKVGERVVGMLSAVSSKPDYFDRSRVRMLSASVDRLVMAFERRRWQEDAERLSVTAEALFSSSRIMSSHGGFDEKAAALLRLAARSINGSAAAFLGAERQGGALRCLAGGPFEADLSPEAIAHSVVGKAQANKAVTPLYNTASDTVVRGLDPDSRFAVAAPVLVAAEVHGILLVAGRAGVTLSPDQLRLVSGVAENLGVLLIGARLGQKVNASLDREFAVLEALKSAAERLAIVDTPSEALGHLVEAARVLIGARLGGVAVWRRSGTLETLVRSDAEGGVQLDSPRSGIVPEVLRLVRFALVQERRSSIVVNDSPFVEGGEQLGAGFNSVLGVPFTCTDGRTGAIFMVDKEPSGRFEAEDERLLGLFCAMVSVLLDNIRLFRAEERERRTLDAIHASMAEGLIVLDDDGQVMFCNAAADTLLDGGESGVRGRSLRAWVLRNLDRFKEADEAKAFAEMLQKRQPGMTELMLFGPVRREVAFTLFPIEVSDGERLTGVLLRDVTDEREHERRRDNFVSIASHELRNPMTVVLGFTELLMNNDHPSERRSGWLKHIYEDSKRVVTIIEDLLNVSRIQSGELDFRIEPVNAPRVLEETADKFRTASGNHRIVVETSTSLPPVMADRDKFTQVVVNLVSNAVKYSPGGGTVTLNGGYDPETKRVVVSVADEGIGISEKDQGRLFNTFERIDRPETEGIKGTGLGLYIVKGLVENMGGEIWLTSAENQGSTFYVALPVLGGDEQAEAE